MSHHKHLLFLFGLCTTLAACDTAAPTNPSEPGAVSSETLGGSPSLPAASNSWMMRRSLSPDRQVMAAGTINGIIYVAGGRHIEPITNRVRVLARVDAYNVATNTWSQVASMPGPREEPNGASVINGKLYVTGGRSNVVTPEQFFKPTKTLFVYNPATNSWMRKADMPQAGCGGVQGVISGKLYVYMPSVRWCNPAGSGGDMARFYQYNPSTNTWMSRATPPAEALWSEAQIGAGGAINGKFYLVGHNSGLHVYDPTSNTWQTRASMSASRSGMKATMLNGKLFLVGGHELRSDFPLPTLEVYNPMTNTWALKAPLPVGVSAGAAVTAEGRIYYVAGRVHEDGGGEQFDSRVYAYAP
jgi:N-acetylneuraminic acid mutarotase